MNTPLFSNKLLLVPLFQGFSRLDFIDIVEKIPLDFKTYHANEVVMKQGEVCQSLCILLDGEVNVMTESPEHNYFLTEVFMAPWVMQQESLFGLHNQYAHMVSAKTEVQVVRISKQSVRDLLMQYPAFHMNFYNALSTYTQRLAMMQWHKRSESIEGRFRFFLQRRCLRPIGVKLLRIRMEVLANELGTTRLRVSNMLAEMAARKVLSYSRGIIKINSLEMLS